MNQLTHLRRRSTAAAAGSHSRRQRRSPHHAAPIQAILTHASIWFMRLSPAVRLPSAVKTCCTTAATTSMSAALLAVTTPLSKLRCKTAVAAASGGKAAESTSRRRLPPVKLDPEVKAKHTRPAGWHAPGPVPCGPGSDPSLVPQANETLSYLTGDWRIFQLKNGHRWSLDDMMTAWVALQEAAAVKKAAAAAGNGGNSSSSSITHTLDIGCGIGSVLLMVAWGLRRQYMEQQQQQEECGTSQQQQQLQGYDVCAVGVEAQTVSFQLAQRSICYNLGSEFEVHRVQVFNQDLRQALPYGPIFQLVTGTPPYIPQGSGGRSDRPQKAPCCIETRGGIEDYCVAAAAALAPEGVFVVCGGIQGQPAKYKGKRAQLAAAAAGLVVVRQVTVVTREGKPPLFAVYVMRKADEVLKKREKWWQEQQQQGSLQDQQALQQSIQLPKFEDQVSSGQLAHCEEVFVVQHASGRHSQAWHGARAAMGLPPLRQT